MTQQINANDFSYDNKNSAAAREKKAIRRVGNITGIALLFVAAVSRYWSYAALLIIKLFNIPRESAKNVFSDAGISQFIQVIFSSFCFIIPFLILAKAFKFSSQKPIPFRRAQNGNFVFYLFIGVAFCAFSNVSLSIASELFEKLGFNYNVNDSALPVGVLGFLLYAVSTAVIPALAEEFAFRGVIYGALESKGESFAIVASAAVFGLMHGNFIQIPFAFLVGIGLGYIRAKSGTVTVCMAVHFINNFVSVVVRYLYESYNTVTINLFYVVYLSVCFALGFVGLKRINATEGVETKKADTVLEGKQKLFTFIFSPVMIVFIIVEIVFSTLFFF